MKLCKKCSFLMVMVLMLIAGLWLAPVKAKADADDKKMPKELTLVYYPGKPCSEITNAWEFPSRYGLVRKKCKSSDPEVVSIERSEDYGGQVAFNYISIKKPGKAVLTVRAEKNGKYKTYKIKVTVKKYSNPLKKLKIGSKDLTKKFNKKNEYATMNKKPLEGKLRIKVKSGYKIKKIYSYWPEPIGNGYIDWKDAEFEDGDSISVKWTGEINIDIQNKKTKETETLKIYLGYAY